MSSRKFNVKTLDNHLHAMEVPEDTKIEDLKVIIQGMLNIAPSSQRLLYKGKALKDSHLLTEYITKDGETIFLVSRVESQPTEQTTGAQGSSQSANIPTGNNGTTQTTQPTTHSAQQASQGQQRANPFDLNGLIGNMMRDPNIMQMAMDIGENMNNTNRSNGTNTRGGNTSNEATGTSSQRSTGGGGLFGGLFGSLFGGGNNQQEERKETTQQNTNTRQVPNSFLREPERENLSVTTSQNNQKQQSLPYQDLNNFSKAVDSFSGEQYPQNYLPRLNYPKNSLTIMGRYLNRYANTLSRAIPYITQISDLLERESLVTDQEERKFLQERVRILSTALDELMKSTTPIVPLLKGLETGNAPGEGRIREVEQPRQRPANPFQSVFSQMMQPENMQSMMGMMDQMLNPRTGGAGANANTGAGMGGLGGLVGNMMNNLMSQPGGLGGLMSGLGMGPADLNRNVSNLSNASVETNVPPTYNRQMSNGGLINLGAVNLERFNQENNIEEQEVEASEEVILPDLTVNMNIDEELEKRNKEDSDINTEIQVNLSHEDMNALIQYDIARMKNIDSRPKDNFSEIYRKTNLFD